MAEETTNNEEHKENDVSQESVNTENTDSAENTTENNSEEFNPEAFSSTPPTEKKKENTSEENSESTENEANEETNVDNDDFTWSDYSSESTQSTENETDTDTNSTNDVSVDNNVQSDNQESNASNDNQEEQNRSLNDDAYKIVAKELGLEAESIDDLKTTLEEIQEENKKLRDEKSSGVTNESIQKLESFKSKKDEELVRMELKKQGFNDEEINRAVDRYIDNDALWIEAKKIRNNIDSAIKREQESVLRTQKDAQAMQEQEKAQAVESLTKYVNEQDSMFGLKMAKDDDGLNKVRKEHIGYITSGDFWGDITKDNKSLTEAAWLWKNKDVILKALGNREFNRGRQEIINDIGNPDIPNTTRHKDPAGSDEFSPQKFIYGD